MSKDPNNMVTKSKKALGKPKTYKRGSVLARSFKIDSIVNDTPCALALLSGYILPGKLSGVTFSPASVQATFRSRRGTNFLLHINKTFPRRITASPDVVVEDLVIEGEPA